MKKKLLKLIRKILGTKECLNLPFFHYENQRFRMIEHIMHDTSEGITKEKYAEHNIIVSLTSYGKRIHDVAFTIESIMQQSMKANRIVLWLDYSFKGKQLPISLTKLQNRGLEIMFCDDLRSYKKLIPSLKKFPHDAIITIDDDLIYEYDLIERLVRAYQENPNVIHACRIRRMKFKNSKPLSYNTWKLCQTEGVHKHNFLTSGGGTLFPPHCFDEEVLNEQVFMDICKFADDVWLTAMALKNGTPINKICTRNPWGNEYLVNTNVQDIGLFNINGKNGGQNDEQIKAVFNKYNLSTLFEEA